MSRPATSFTVHAEPRIALSSDTLGFPLELRFGFGLHPSVVIFTGSQELTDDLAAAINAVLARHRDLAGANGRPEGGA